MKRCVVPILKFAVPVAIVVYLVFRMDRQQPGQFTRLWEQSKNWPLLVTGFCLVMTAVALTFVRWWLLVRALDLPFRLTEALRLGFLGYLFNFVGIGAVGGDLLKAVYIARRQPGRRTQAVATVVLDRVIGMYVLLIVATAAILASDVSRLGAAVQALREVMLLTGTVGTVTMVLALTLPIREGPWHTRLGRIPYAGPMFLRLVSALQAYRRRLGCLAAVFGLSLLTQVLFPMAFYLIGASLFQRPPTPAQHFMIVPLSMCTGVIPTPGGMGTFEFAMDELYRRVAPDSDAQGLIVALAYRAMTIGVATIGIVYYWTGRREVRSLLEQTEAEQRHTAPSTCYGP